MILLKVIRALFPAKFQRQYGDEWESLAEDVLAHARNRGGSSYLRAWRGLLWDTSVRALGACQAMARNTGWAATGRISGGRHLDGSAS